MDADLLHGRQAECARIGQLLAGVGESRSCTEELQIAGFVAEGLTNREVAALAISVSPRTVDFHLRDGSPAISPARA